MEQQKQFQKCQKQLSQVKHYGPVLLDTLTIGKKFDGNTLELSDYTPGPYTSLNGYEIGEYNGYFIFGKDPNIPALWFGDDAKYYSNSRPFSEVEKALGYVSGREVGSKLQPYEQLPETYYGEIPVLNRYGTNSLEAGVYKSFIRLKYKNDIKLCTGTGSDASNLEGIALSYILTSEKDWAYKQEAIYAYSGNGGQGLDENKYKEAFDYARFYQKASAAMGEGGIPSMDPKLTGGGVAVGNGNLMVGPFSLEYNEAVSDDVVFGGISDMYLKGYYSEYYYDEASDKYVFVQDHLVNERIDIDYYIGSQTGARSLSFFKPNEFFVDNAKSQSYPCSGESFYAQLSSYPKGEIPFDYCEQNGGGTEENPSVTYVTLCVEFKWCSLGEVGINELAAERAIAYIGATDGYKVNGVTPCKCNPCNCGIGDGTGKCNCQKPWSFESPAKLVVRVEYESVDVWNLYGERKLYGMILEGDYKAMLSSMKLGGYVWEDALEGKENIGDSLNKSEADIPLEGITVQLYNSKDKLVKTTKTNSQGFYQFTGLNPLNKYYVKFEYNGQMYMAVDYLKIGGEKGNVQQASNAKENFESGVNWKENSKAVEIEREEFNKKFETIGAGSEYKNTLASEKPISEDKANAMNAITQNLKGEKDLYPVYDSFQVTGDVPVGDSFNIIDDKGEASVDPETGIETKPTTSTTNNMQDNKHLYINLGLTKRPQADAAIRKDLYRAAVKINGHTEVYNYSRGVEQNDSFWEIETRLADANYYGPGYDRPMYSSDVYYTNEDKNKELKVYVTYKITARNQSEEVLMELKEIVDYYDSSFTLRKDLSWVADENGVAMSKEDFFNMIANAPASESGSRINVSESTNYKANSLNGYKSIYITNFKGKKLAVGEDATIYLTFEVNKNTITPESVAERINIAEINAYSTYYKNGTILPNNVVIKNDNTIAGLIDVDSNPGNLSSVEGKDYEKSFEDDTDRAKGIKIYINKDLTRKINGTVWEDKRTSNIQGALIGDGVLNSGEKGYEGVKVSLYEVIDGKTQNEPAKVYNNGWAESNSVTASNGNYTISGYVPGDYIVRFTYPNGQDYKSTIYQAGLSQPGTDDRQDGKKVPGYTNYESQNTSASYGYNIKVADDFGKRVSDAKDIWEYREKVNNYGMGSGNGVGNNLAEELANVPNEHTQMVAETGVIRVEVEYNKEFTEMDEKTDYNIKNLDFGIVERPKASLELDKKVSNLKVTLSDGQVLFDTNKSVNNVIWTSKTDSLYGGLIQAIMDEELMDQANIQITYKLQVKNTGEVDFDDKEFYYVGKVGNASSIVKTSADLVVDYVSNNIQFISANNNGNWQANRNIEVAPEVLAHLSEYNTIITTNKLGAKLEPGQTSEAVELVLSQVLAPQGDSQYSNIAEIITYTNGVGRRLTAPGGESITPGNQNPTEDPQEQDSSKAEDVAVVPPYGQAHFYITLAIVIALLIAVAVILIKIKVLKKK